MEHFRDDLPVAPALHAPMPKVTVKEVVPWLFGIYIMVAELFVTVFNVRVGMFMHALLLLVLLVLASVLWYREGRAAVRIDEAVGENVVIGTPGYRFYLSLTLAPIIRILSLAIPMWNFPVVYWYVVTGAPLLLTSYVIMKVVGYRPADVCLRLGRLRKQAVVALVGFPLGWTEYQILRPTPVVPGGNVVMLIMAGLILLVFTGLVEEVIFRGVLLKAADDYLGKTHSLVYCCFIFAILHIIHSSALDVVFVFGVGLLFIFFVRRTRSLLGVAVAHGITNIMLYLVCPLLLH